VKSVNRFVFLLVFVILGLSLYANSFKNEFLFDDIPLIVENHAIKKLENIPKIVGLSHKRLYYRPLRMVSYALDYHLFKLQPEGYHLSNTLFHIITAWLVFLVIGHLSKNNKIALLGTLLFIIHPINTDSVTYISGRRDILSTLFYVLGFYFFLRNREHARLFYPPLIILSFLLALLSKEMAVTLPAIFFIYDYINNFQAQANGQEKTKVVRSILLCLKILWRKYALFYLFFFLGALFFVYYKLTIAPPSNLLQYWGGSLWSNFFTVARILVYYLKLLLFPIPLNADYSFNAFPVTHTLLDISAWLSFIVLGIALWAGVKMFHYNRMITFFTLWFFITLLPVCHIFPHHELLAEHYLYLPSIGIFFLGGLCIHNNLRTKPVFLYYTLSVLLLVLFSIRTIDRNQDWKDALTLWQKTIKTAPRCARAQNNLGVEYYKLGEYEKAEEAYQKALQINPKYPDPYHNLGNILADNNQFVQALEYYKMALEHCPQGAEKEIFNSLGVMYKKQGKLKEAKALFFTALKEDPFYVNARNNMAAVYYAEGNYARAYKALTFGLKIDPRSPEIHNNLGNIYKKQGDLQRAVEEFHEAIRLKPDFMEAYNNIQILEIPTGKQARLTMQLPHSTRPLH
jgi:tetratricopeptide (TPR) repeat protein